MKTFIFVIAFFLSLASNVELSWAVPDDGSRGTTGGTSVCDADAFYQKLGQCESGAGKKKSCVGADNNSQYSRINPDGCIGKYQFCESTLAQYTNDPQAFLKSPEMQERIMRENTARNDAWLEKKGAYKYIGQVRNGVTLTRSGLLAAAHLGGKGGALKLAERGYNPDDGATTLSEYAALMGGFDIMGAGTDGTCGYDVPPEALRSDGTFDKNLIGCDPAIKEGATARTDALKQQETEAAKALITKPASVQQLTCFDQYTKVNADKIGKIHSDPEKGISDTIVPNVEVPAMQNVIQNFMTNVLGGGLQSMLNGAMGQITGALGMGGGAGGAGTCGAMDEMWKLLQCMDFPKMPSLSDIMGGGGGGAGDMLSGALSGLGGAGGLGSLGSGGGGGGLMGAVCQAMKGAMGGGGSGGTDVFEKLAEEMNKPVEQNDLSEGAEDLRDQIKDVVNGTDDSNSCDYAGIAQTMTNMDADLNNNNIIEATELERIDTLLGNKDCVIQDTEITFAVNNPQATEGAN